MCNRFILLQILIIVFLFDNPAQKSIFFPLPIKPLEHNCYCDLFSTIKYLSQNCVTFQFQPEENTAIWAKTGGNAVLNHLSVLVQTEPEMAACLVSHIMAGKREEFL